MFDLDSVFSDCVRNEGDLEDYQRYAVDWMYEHSFSGLWAGVGLGKTIMVLTLLDRLFSEGYTAKVLIVAPIRVVNTVWGQELRKWSHTCWMSSTILRVENDDPKLLSERQRISEILKPNLAHMADRKVAAKTKASLIGQHLTAVKDRLWRKLLRSRSLIHLINHEAVDKLVDHYVTRKKPWPYKVIIWDESSKLRDHNSNVFNSIRHVRPYAIRIHELTATPAKQSYLYLFPQVYLLDQGERFGRGVTAFRQRYFTENRYSRRWDLRPGGAEAIEQKISDIVLPLRKRDFVDTPEPTIRIRSVVLPDLEQYKEFERTAILETPDEEVIQAQSAGILNGKLLQLASGAVYDAKREVHYFHDAKLDELEQLIDEVQGEPVLVSYWFKSTLARLKKRFPKAVTMDQQGKMVKSWNAGKHRLMFIHPASASHGIELQFGGHILCVLDLFHSAELFEQLIGRIDRRGQENDVIVHLLAAQGTIDGVVSKRLQRLEEAQSAMFNRLQRLHRKLRQNA